jgi:hypothetical protein
MRVRHVQDLPADTFGIGKTLLKWVLQRLHCWLLLSEGLS